MKEEEKKVNQNYILKCIKGPFKNKYIYLTTDVLIIYI